MDFLTCSRCSESKHPIEFDRYKKGSEKRQPYCKTCRVLFQREYYRKNPEKKKKRNYVAQAQKVKETRAEISELKKQPCMDCGEKFHPCAMDFDHRDPREKVSDIASLIRTHVLKSRLYAEIAKCDLVCANCHRVRTFVRRKNAPVA